MLETMKSQSFGSELQLHMNAHMQSIKSVFSWS
jgi:hypothetical protein